MHIDATSRSEQKLYNSAHDPSNSSAQAEQNIPPRMVSTRTDTGLIINTTASTTPSNTALADTLIKEQAQQAPSSITLRNRHQAQPVLINTLPTELKHYIFNQLPHTALFDPSLFALAVTCRDWHSVVKAFLSPERICVAFGGKTLRREVVAQWQARNQYLSAQIAELRRNFKTSRQLIAQGIAAQASAEVIAQSVSHLSGVDLNVKEINDAALLSELIARLHQPQIKVSARDIGCKRFTQQLIPALAQLNAGCLLALDASGNYLRSRHLQTLINVLIKNSCTTQLDLSGNPLFFGEKDYMPLLALFDTPSPLSHLYLAVTGLNDKNAYAISKLLTGNPCLQHLDLRNNYLSNDGAKALISALAFISQTGEIRTNTALKALRLQSNSYSFNDLEGSVFSAVEATHQLLARANNPQFDPQRHIPMPVIQIDGVAVDSSSLTTMQHLFQDQFDANALFEKL